jgi:hypothetical protein
MPSVEASNSEPDLHLDEDRTFQERMWRAQRVAWVGFGVIVVAALAGLTGVGGPFARATEVSAAGAIDYPRVARWEADDSLVVTFAPSTQGGRTVSLSREFLDLFEIVDIEPHPAGATATGDGETLAFDVAPGTSATVALKVRSAHPGLTTNYVALDGRQQAVPTLVLP